MSDYKDDNNIPKFKADDYQDWITSLTAYLQRADLFRVATGDYSLPDPAIIKNATFADIERWHSKNQQILGVLTVAVGSAHKLQVAGMKSAVEAWRFCKSLEPKNASSATAWLGELIAKKFSHGEDFDEHVSQLQALQTKLNGLFSTSCKCDCSCAASADLDQMKLLVPNQLLELLLVHSMPEELATHVAITEAIGNRELTQTIRMLKSYYLQLTAKSQVQQRQPQAFVGQAKPSISNQRNKKCSYCKKSGHIEEACLRKQIDDLKAVVEKQRGFEKASVAFALSASSPLKFDTYLDSGASRHMVVSKEKLEHFTADQKQVQVGNSAFLDSPGYGDWIVGGITLKNAMFVPGLAANLISVGGLTTDKKQVIFDGDTCSIYDNGSVVAQCVRSADDMWPLSTAKALLTGSQEAELWHARLGHVSLKRANQQLNISGQQCFCQTCVISKQRRRVSRSAATRATAPGQLYHTDTCGPIPVLSLDGYKYFTTITDDYSRASFVWFTKQKTDYASVLEEFIAFSTTQTGNKIKTIRSDNGTEFVNASYSNLLAKHGIHHETSVPYTPEQNGVAERLNLTLWDMARAMLLHCGCPGSFWRYAIDYAIYIKNRIHTSAIAQDKTPYELYTGKRADLSQLRIFGCTAYYHIPNTTERKKLDPRASRSVFVGISRHSKGYILYDIEKRKVVISQTVTFK
jgi:transposase InsO family protein